MKYALTEDAIKFLCSNGGKIDYEEYESVDILNPISTNENGSGVTFFGEAAKEGFVVESGKPSMFTGNMFMAIDEEMQSLCEQTLGVDILDYMYPNYNIPELGTDEGIKYLIDCIYPIGHITETTNENFNPNVSYSWQTWERYGNGRVTVGVDESDSDFAIVGFEVGEKKHELTVEELPSHSHAQYVTANSGGSGLRQDFTADKSGVTTYPQGVNTGSTGGGLAHNNIQPSVTVYRWRRTA